MLHRYIAIVLGLPLIGACAPPASIPVKTSRSGGAPAATVASATEQPVRVIVKFSTTVAYRDPAFLQDLARQIQARLSYVASVSERTHVYLLVPLPGQPMADAITRLMHLPTVESVERDAIATPS